MRFSFFKKNNNENNAEPKKIKKIVTITGNVINGLISYSKMHHPYEGILILEGKEKKQKY